MTPEKVIAALLVRRAAQLLAISVGGLVVSILLLGVVRVGLALLAGGGAAMAMSARSRL